MATAYPTNNTLGTTTHPVLIRRAACKRRRKLPVEAAPTTFDLAAMRYALAQEKALGLEGGALCA